MLYIHILRLPNAKKGSNTPLSLKEDSHLLRFWGWDIASSSRTCAFFQLFRWHLVNLLTKKIQKKSICNLTIGQEISYTLELLVRGFQFPNSRFSFSISSWQSFFFLPRRCVRDSYAPSKQPCKGITRNLLAASKCQGRADPGIFFSQPKRST